MSDTQTPQPPYPKIDPLECKACGRCIEACPKQVLTLGTALNARGYRFVEYAGSGCSGCGNCYYACPEPHAIEVHIPPRRRRDNDSGHAQTE